MNIDNQIYFKYTNSIINVLEEYVQKVSNELWKNDHCKPVFFVSLNNSDMNNQEILITIDHLGNKFTERLFPRKDADYGYSSILDLMINMYNRTM